MSCCAASRQAVSASPSQPHLDQAPVGSPSGSDRSTGSQEDHGAVPLPGGTFWMGSEDGDVNPHDGEGPVRQVSVDAFAISRSTVTNREFSRFVDQTGYITEAEEYGWSFVFAAFLTGKLRAASPRPQQTPWWCAVQGAAWSAPQGPGSGLAEIMDHPVVHVSWRDAEAYAAWAQGRLPSEVEWEYAARGGLHQARYPWGDELMPASEHRCNIWQGRFPVSNTAEDGYRGTAPADAFPPNGYGLHNMAGNVWEMCADYWTTAGPSAAADGEVRRVNRGGSYLCHDSYCNRYRVAARSSNGADSSTGNQGFRLAFDL